jgi:hypothetical protein
MSFNAVADGYTRLVSDGRMRGHLGDLLIALIYFTRSPGSWRSYVLCLGTRYWPSGERCLREILNVNSIPNVSA